MVSESKNNKANLKFAAGMKYGSGSQDISSDNPTIADVEEGLNALHSDKGVTSFWIRVENVNSFPQYVYISVEVQPSGTDERATILYLYQEDATTFKSLYMVTPDGADEEQLYFDDNNALDPITMRKSVSVDIAKFAIRHFYKFQKPLPDAVLEYL